MALKGFGDIQKLLSGTSPADIIELQKSAIPKMTGAARDALSGANLFPGLLIYNTTTNKLNVRVAAAWEVITSA